MGLRPGLRAGADELAHLGGGASDGEFLFGEVEDSGVFVLVFDLVATVFGGNVHDFEAVEGGFQDGVAGSAEGEGGNAWGTMVRVALGARWARADWQGVQGVL